MSANVEKSIAIIGMGANVPGASSVAELYENLQNKVSAISEVDRDRWDPELYYDPDPAAPDKSYSKIGGFLGEVSIDRRAWRIPPRVVEVLDPTQLLALSVTHEALQDAGLDSRDFARDRCAVIFGNSMGGDNRDESASRVAMWGFLKDLTLAGGFAELDAETQDRILAEVEEKARARYRDICEDTMAGELSNVVAGRVAAAFKLSGPNYTVDAACASSLAALSSAIHSLRQHHCDLAITGGVDRNMSPATYVKFCKTHALSADRSSPFDAGANGFVMGEGAGVFVLKRLDDALRDGDRIRSVIVGCGGSSDGGGRGITAPNPEGQLKALLRAYEDAGVSPASIGFMEAHGTSTRAGDGAEVETISKFVEAGGERAEPLPVSSIKSGIGHLKSAAGAAGLAKTVLALENKALLPSLNFEVPNDALRGREGVVRIQTELEEWRRSNGTPRRAGLSAFGFGGTNFHMVVEEPPGRDEGRSGVSGGGSGSWSGFRKEARPSTAESGDAFEGTQQAKSTSQEGSVQEVSTNMEDVLTTLKAVVSRKTGYDEEELEGDLELEADLGVDTVKQAEIMAQVRESYGLERDESFRLSDYPTLDDMARYVVERMSSSAGGTGTTERSADDDEGLDEDGEGDRGWGRGRGRESDAKPVGLPSVALLRVGAEDKGALLRKVESMAGQLDRGASLESLAVLYGQPIDHHNVRLGVTAASTDELSERIDQVRRLITTGKGAIKLAGSGTHLAEGEPSKVAFLFPGQGSQYVGMMGDLLESLPVVGGALDEADSTMSDLLEHPLSHFMLGKVAGEMGGDVTVTDADAALRQTTITQPAVLAADVALLRVLDELGVRPDMVAGHSLGEYAACVAAGVLEFSSALRVVAARGREMTDAVPEGGDPGLMAVVAGPADQVESVLEQVDGYVVAANKNSPSQTVVAGSTEGVKEAMEIFSAKKISCKLIPVSHAFHTRVVSAASDPLRKVLERSSVKGPKLPIFSNVTAELYPKEPGEVADLLARQVASPVEFIAIVEKMYERGARTFVELGPKRALTGFVRDILGRRPHRAVTTNHPKKGGPRTLVEALASLAADGQPIGPTRLWKEGEDRAPLQVGQPAETDTDHRQTRRESFAEGGRPRSFAADDGADASVWITGAAVGLPGFDKMFDDGNLERFLDGQNLIKPLERKIRQRIAEQSIVRLVKSEDGTGELVEVESPDQVMAFAGRGGELDLDSDYGVGAEWESDKDSTTKLALAAAFEALRDSWIPLVEQRKSVSNGRSLGMGFRLPEQEASTTGVIFASAFPGYERLLSMVEDLRDGKPFPRSALLQMLSVGHALVAERVGALGPNLQLNTACSSTTTAVGVAQDWIRAGRCDRVLVLGADDVTSEALMPWVGGGFLAVGAATTEEDLSRAAVPFGAGRNGLVLGMGAVGLVVERADRARRRGVTPLMEIVSTRMANSASHPMRLRPKHIAQEVDALVEEVCVAEGLSREEIAGQLVFMSHETYTPARGGSAEAEANALREAFGPHAGEVLVVNTKGYTGHPMAAGIEEGILAAGLWANKLPGVANLDSPDPAFQDLTFHRGGPIERKYALRLAAGFGSQIGLAFFKRGDGQGDRLDRSAYRSYLAELTGTDRPEVVMDRRVLRARSAHRAGDSELPDALEATPAVLPDTEPSPRPTEEAEPAVAGKQTASAAPPRRVTTEAVLCRLQEVVSEKTGYDVEELEGDLELEADLGVDTVKQAEIMATVRESYGLERDESFRLSDYPTLDDMARYVMERMGSTRPTAENQAEVESAVPVPEGAEPGERPGEEGETAETAGTVAAEEVLCLLQEVVSEKTGYDVDELEGDLELEADLGVDTVKQAEIMATVRESYGLERDESFRLSDYPTLDDMARYVMERMGSIRPTAENQAEVESAVPVPEGAEPGERPGEEGETAETAGTVAAEEVLCLLQEVVSEKTGYDVDELEGDLELEADLGVDTVKQAEIMATVRESYGLERDESFRLSDYPTLDDMARYVMERMGSGRPTPDPESGPEGDGRDGRADSDADGAAPWTRGERPWDLGDGFSIQRLSYRPQPIERGGDDSSPFFEGEAGRVDGAVLLVSRERSGPLGLELARETFGSKAKVARLPSEKLAGADRQELAQKLEVLFEQQGASRLHSVVWVQEERATVEEQASALDALRLAQAIGDVFEGSPPVSSWVTVALEAGKSVGMESRGCLGFSRCLSHEWPGCRVETVSVDPKGASLEKGQGWGRVGREIGGLLGRSPTGRHVRLTPEGMAVGEPAPFTELEPRSLPPDAVVLVTGAMGGVGSIAVRALCEAWGCRFVLTGRREEIATPAPELVSRKEMRERLRRQGRRPTPVAIDREMSRLARDRAASELVEELTSRGVSFFYHPADLTDERDVDALVEECKKRWGRLDVVVHAAGLEWSRALGQKTAEEMETVWEAKAGAAVRLCESCRRVFGSLPERFVSFGSVAGVFGNGGQCDYAAANAALAGLSALYPSETEFLTVHWTGWDNVGMTESPRIREALLQRNVQLLPSDLGEVAIARLVASAAQGEVVVCGELGALAEAGPAISPASARRAEDDRASARASMSGGEPYLLEVDQHSGGATLIWEIDSSIDWLRDHAIESVCVLPGVVGLELMARAAERLLPEGQRDVSVEDVRFLRPVKVFEGGPTVVRVRAARGEGGEVSVALDSVRETRRGPLEQSHFEARIVGRQEDAEGGNGRPFALRRLDRQGPEKKEIYECFFHGPRFQVLESVRLVGADGLVATGRVGPLDLTGGDAGRPNRVNPLLVEAVFQAAGFHALMEDGTLALPTGIGRMEMSSVTRSFGAEGEGASRDVVIRVRRTGGDPKGARPRRFRFDGEVMTPAGRRICRLYGCEMSGLDSVKPPEGRRAFEVVEIPLASLGDEDRLLVDLENELAPGEMRQASKIAHSRRRLEWIAGRLAAKELVRLHLRDRHGIGVGRSDVEIASEPGGAPVALLPGRPSLSGLLPALSITHAAGRALVMGVPSFEPEARLGLDLVPIEPRGPAFEKEWLTESEGRLIAGSSSPERDRRVSSIWALKEAVSKALGLGLHLTTAELEVMSIDPNGLAVMRLAGKARLRYGSLGARGLTCGVQMRADTVIAWARLDLTEETLDRPEPHPSPAWCRTLTLPM